MSDIVQFITNLEPYAVIGIGLTVCLLTFFLIDIILSKKKNSTHNSEFENIGVCQQSDDKTEEVMSAKADNFTNTQECLNKIINEVSSLERNQIQELLSIAASLESNPKSKIRLNVMLKKYISTNYGINDIFKMYMPELLGINAENTQFEVKEPLLNLAPQENQELTPETLVNVDNSEVQNISVCAVNQNKEETKEIAEKDTINDKNEEISDKLEDTIDTTISLDKQIETLSSSRSLQKSQNEVAVHVPCHDVWANYMCFDNGRMNLKNSFFHLENAWGSVSSIAELQDKISLEISDGLENEKKEWAMVSVIPFHEPKF